MPTLNGHVYYNATNNLAPGVGIESVPVVLYNTATSEGVVALTDASGAFAFNNVPDGSYQVIEAWGAPGGIVMPVDFSLSAAPMPFVPAEAEPPLSALPIAPPPLADKLMALSPNLQNIIVSGTDIANLTFYDGPVGDKALNFLGVSKTGPNLITAADNGTMGSYPPGQAANSTAPATPYPGVTPGFTYTTNVSPADGFYTVTNTSSDFDFPTSPWWVSSDHTTGLETGRFMVVNGDNPGAVIFTQTVSVKPNTNYLVSAWVMNLIRTQSGFQLPRLGLRVWDQNGNLIVIQAVNPIPPQGLPVWYENGFLFNSVLNTSVTLQIVSLGLAAVGNDYIIDDISMFEAQFMDLLTQNKAAAPSVIYSETGVDESVTVTVQMENPSGTTVNNVFFQDVLDPRLQFIPGTLTVDGSPTAFDPNTGFSLGNMAPGQVITVEFQATTTGGPAVIPNTAAISYDAVTSATGDVIRAEFPTNTVTVEIITSKAIINIIKSADKMFANFNDIITYTLTINNTGNTAANNIVITDTIPTGATFVAGSLTGATGTPPTLTLANPIPAGGSSVVSFQVQVDGTIPTPNLLLNTAGADFTFTVDPSVPDGANGTGMSNTVATQINRAIVTATKAVDKTFASPGDILTYTLTLQNSGSTAATNVVITDPLPSGTTFVPGSVTGATGAPPTLTLDAPIPAGGSSVVTYQLKLGNTVPNPNPVLNTAAAAYTYTIDPANPNGASAVSFSNTASAQVNTARLNIEKRADKTIAYIGDTITYQIAVTNSGNVPADNVVITDLIPTGTIYVPGSLTVDVSATGTPATGITLTDPIAPEQTVAISFQINVTGIPNPNPIVNIADAAYDYTVDPADPDGVSTTAESNPFSTVVFRYNYSQPISDLIESVALEQAALAAIANAEGAKIQRMVAMGNVTSQELLCLNKSVSDMVDTLSLLESILKQKLNTVSCQISGTGAGC